MARKRKTNLTPCLDTCWYSDLVLNQNSKSGSFITVNFLYSLYTCERVRIKQGTEESLHHHEHSLDLIDLIGAGGGEVPKGSLEHTLRTTGLNWGDCSLYQWFRMDTWPNSDKREMKGILQSIWKSFFRDKKGSRRKTELGCFCGSVSWFCVCLGSATGAASGWQSRHRWATTDHVWGTWPRT